MTTEEPTLRERAESLLRIHNEKCSISKGHELVDTFREMEREGLVKMWITPNGHIDVWVSQPTLIE